VQDKNDNEEDNEDQGIKDHALAPLFAAWIDETQARGMFSNYMSL
jgi:hypothetical protein